MNNTGATDESLWSVISRPLSDANEHIQTKKRAKKQANMQTNEHARVARRRMQRYEQTSKRNKTNRRVSGIKKRLL